MADGVQGDWPRLERVRVSIDGMHRGDRARLVRVVGTAAETAFRAGFDRGAAPDGSAWAPTREGGTPLAGFEQHWTLRYRGSIATLASDHPGARAHQRGATILPKRRGVGRGAGGRFTKGTLGVLAFVVGGRKVFARKVKIPARRMTPRNGSLEGWVTPIRAAVEAELTAMWEGR